LLVSEDSILDVSVNLPSNPLMQIMVQNPSAGSLMYQTGGNYIYTPQVPAQVFDTFTVRHCSGTDAFDTEIIVAIASCVWSGDSDTNQLVNNFDLLPIGLNYGSSGSPRPNAGLDWDCEPMTDWAPLTGQVNPKHADTNGDGFIDDNDTLAITNNWGSFYLRSLSSSTGAVPLYLDSTTAAPGDTILLDVKLGSALQNAVSVYGIAFTVNYDNSMVDTNSVLLKYNNSWLGVKGQDLLTISKDFYDQGRTEVAMVRTDRSSRSNQGAIAQFQFTIKDDVLNRSNPSLNLSVSNIRMIDSLGTELPVTGLPSSVLILPTSINQQFLSDEHIIIYPNPANDFIYFNSNNFIDKVTVFSSDSREMFSIDNPSAIDISKLNPGFYIIKLQIKDKVFVEKIIKK